MRVNLIASLLAAPLLALAGTASAKGAITQIEIARGKHPLVTLADPDGVADFTIWSGPGTQITAADGTVSTPVHPGDIADWAAGAVQAPRKATTYKVRFYCAATDAPPAPGATRYQCYGVRYAIDAKSGAGYIQIPPADDAEFPGNTQSMLRGGEGQWYRASALWEQRVHPRIDAANAARANDNSWLDNQPYIYTPPPTAVGAKPTLTPKSR
ncbi:MAG TPA: hypothetical protein VFL16_18105 [Steroidobacteraceae bacterium]|nr:hypothetical protein [Steroidobacteraceae bacterium]